MMYDRRKFRFGEARSDPAHPGIRSTARPGGEGQELRRETAGAG